MRRILISGGSRGIGRACVRAFAQNGDAVAFLYCRNDDAAREVASETGATAIRADISDPDAVRAAVAEAENKLGGTVDVLINNAAVAWIGLMQDMTDTEWHRVLDTNLSGAFYLSRAVVSGMIRNHYGRILHVGSMWGKTGASCEVAYSATKGAVIAMSKALAQELGPSGVRVNCVAPGVILTDMCAGVSEDTLEHLRQENLVGRNGTAEDVAKAIAYLTDAEFISGQVLAVNGGLVIT